VNYLLQRKLYIHAFQKLNEIIDSGYQEDDAYALRGSILTVRGRYSEALDDYTFGLSSDGIWHREGEAYANTLRSFWLCEEANELRETIRLFGAFPKGAKLRLYSGQIEDLRYCGETSRAWDLQAEMEGFFPRAVLSHFASAELFLDQGDIDAAYRELWLSQQKFQHIGWKDISARIALMEGRYEEAFQLMQYIGIQRVSDVSLQRFMLSAILANDPAMAIHKTDQIRWSSNENPIIIYLRIMAFQSLGWTEKKEAEQEWLQTICDETCQVRVLWSLEKELGYGLEGRF
jgi:tetratricopeptide (TPR) repeat protein